MRLVQSNPRSADFEATVDEELIVYQKYQVAVHKDPITKVHMEQFKRFLIDSPLKVCTAFLALHVYGKQGDE